MNELLQKIAHCIEFGKINKISPYPPDMKGMDGADELTVQALAENIAADDILKKALVPAMEKVGVKFRENKIFVPQVLMSAKAMNTSILHLKPYFQSGEVKRKGTFIVGTVAGDLHDIGKNLVAMMVEGNGFEVIDLGTDVGADRFIESLKEHPDSSIGISALLTTTMVNMEGIVKEVKNSFPKTKIAVGGAPVNEDFRKRIGADFYSPDPQGVVEYLNSMVV